MKRNKTETIFDVLKKQAAVGDVDGILKSLADEFGYGLPPQIKGRYLRETIDAAAKRNLNGLIETMLGRAIADTAELLARASLNATARTQGDDRVTGGPSFSEPQGEAAERDLERMLRLQDRLVSLTKARGTILHTLALAKAPAASAASAASSRVIKLNDFPTQEMAAGE